MAGAKDQHPPISPIFLISKSKGSFLPLFFPFIFPPDSLPDPLGKGEKCSSRTRGANHVKASLLSPPAPPFRPRGRLITLDGEGFPGDNPFRGKNQLNFSSKKLS